MTKAILKKVTIPQAFEIQGNFSSSVQKYIFKNPSIKDILWRINKYVTESSEIELFKAIIENPNNLKFKENISYSHYDFCEILKYLPQGIIEEINFANNKNEISIIDVLSKIIIEVSKKIKEEIINDLVELYDFSNLEIITSFNNVKIIKDTDFYTKMRKKDYRNTFGYYSYSFNNFSENELKELEEICKKYKSRLLLIDNNLAYLTKETQVRFFTEFGRWISIDIFE